MPHATTEPAEHPLLVAVLLGVFGYSAIAASFGWVDPRVGVFLICFFLLCLSVYGVGLLRRTVWLQWLGIGLTIVYLLGINIGPTLEARRIAPTSVHDGILETESAIRLVERGINPYGHDYSDVLGDDWKTIVALNVTLPNPAVKHFIYLPFYFLPFIPVDMIMRATVGWFDFRLVLWTIGMICVAAVASLPWLPVWKRQLWVVIGTLNPLFFPFLIAGRNDVYILALITSTILLIERKRWVTAAVMYALACTVKQQAWFLMPFIGMYIWGQYQHGALSANVLKRCAWVFFGIVFAVILPFFLWSPANFVNDVYRYPAGTLADSYPINGFSIPALLYSMGFIERITDPAPTGFLLLVVVAPLAVLLLYRQWKRNTLMHAVVHYAIFLCVFWICSRFFHDNYFGFIIELLLLGWLIAPVSDNLA